MAAASEMSTDERLRLITRNLRDVNGMGIVKGCLEGTGTMNVYWEAAPTKPPHIAYLQPIVKLADFLKANCEVTILFVDLQAYLDDVRPPRELMAKRTEYYEILIKGVLKSLNVPIERLRFVRGDHFQFEENFSKALYQMIRLTSVNHAIRAVREVFNKNSDPLLSSLICPLLQALDEEFLNVDAHLRDFDHRMTDYKMKAKNLRSIPFAKRASLMHPKIHGLTRGQMISSGEDWNIYLLDSEETLRRKLQSVDSQGKRLETNCMLAFLDNVALPMQDQLNIRELNVYKDIGEIEDDVNNGKVTEEAINDLVASILWSLMSPLKQEFVRVKKENLIDEAYQNVLSLSTEKEKNLLKDKILSQNDLADLRSEFPHLSDVTIGKAPTIENQPSIMWSCRCSGDPHIGYLIPIKKLATLSKKNWKVIILIEDIGAFLHSKHSSNRPPWDALERRAHVYREMCERSFELLGGNRVHLEIVLGSEFQLSKGYMMQLYQCFTNVTLVQCTHILEQLFKNDSNVSNNLSSVIYPCLSALDQEHLGPTVRVFGERVESVDELLMTAIGLEHQRPIYAYHENIVALDGRSPMSSPELGPRSIRDRVPMDTRSISICDNEDIINWKVNKAFMDLTNLDSNPILRIIEGILWPHLAGSVLSIKRSAQNGGDIIFKCVADIKESLQSEKLHPKSLKATASKHFFDLIINPLGLRSSSFTIQCPEPPRDLWQVSFNPNKINLHVAKVTSITFTNDEYRIIMQCGIKKFTVNKQTDCNLTENDLYLVIMRPSTSTTPSTIRGIVRLRNQTSLALIKKTYMDRVTFANHGVSVPHFEDIDFHPLVQRVEEYLVIRSKFLFWREDGSRANEIEFTNESDGDLPIKIDRILTA